MTRWGLLIQPLLDGGLAGGLVGGGFGGAGLLGRRMHECVCVCMCVCVCVCVCACVLSFGTTAKQQKAMDYFGSTSCVQRCRGG